MANVKTTKKKAPAVAAAKRKTAKGAPARKPATPKKAIAVARKPAAAKKAGAATQPAAKKPAPRADFGAPIDGFFAKQPAQLRPILEALRGLVEEVVPEAESSIKWGMPFYTLDGTMMCALGGHKSHVNLILSGPPGTYADPNGRLTGDGKTGRHLKLTSLDELPRESVRGWLRSAAAHARRP
jgi:hypothetical protein